MAAGALRAAVPNRITYQGRLSQSGAPKGGSHTFLLRLLDSSNQAEISSTTTVKVLPPTGEFSLTFTLPSNIDWLGKDPILELTVDGGKMNPNEVFSATPYALAAQTAASIADGAVGTAKISDGAVTDAKIAAGTGSIGRSLVERSEKGSHGTPAASGRKPAEVARIDHWRSGKFTETNC